MTIALQIDQFPNREGSIKKVKKALGVGKLDDVKLLEMDPEMGLFIISTTRDPDAIKRAIEIPFPEKKIICVHLQDAQPPLQTNVTPSAPPIPQLQIWDGDTLQGTVSGFFADGRLTIYDMISK
ncbi:hypothetical protein HanRHA438_Chr14g0675591 [Helianthus annuus]|nr:hypothetical protein HanHA300_Chr14g0541501 [Helianthus annuus]KAJ0470638.1 hypothetical protein HanIR_Chr14g0720911 [Helianthus annuus]KAJ0487337.1 hypothetical protein HanHA89_Chr14g0589281 [Helianthus annuus]KAJ0661448.1 hypothetical protein HanOQP8_Chr14g0548621 [Helianthus annuus]KAJ0855646.1 hypothetical protein HanRHA438_Chr14g0675591 [Helianthus annuus]